MPGPSTNRDRATPFEPRRHYFGQRSSVAVWRIRLTALALLLSLGWIGLYCIRKDGVYADVSHGPLVRAHSAWNNRCDVCHIPYGEAGCQFRGLMESHDRWHAFQCENCHAASAADPKNYAPHYSVADRDYLQDDARSRDCSTCHHEHQGQDSTLSRIADSECVRCHRDLRQLHIKDPPREMRTPAVRVTAFHKDHPEFRLLSTGATLKRGLTFNHALHMAPGIAPTPKAGDGPGNPNALFRLENVDARFREQYRKFATPTGSNGSPVIRLDCSACHQLDTGRDRNPQVAGASGLPGELAFPARPAGAYYLPIAFEKNCQACHGLNVSGLVTKEGLHVDGFEIPHRLQPDKVERFIRGEIVRQVEAQKEILLKTPLPPNDRLDPLPSKRSVIVPDTLRTETEKLVTLYNQMLYDLQEGKPGSHRLASKGGYACLKCHVVRSAEIGAGRRPSNRLWFVRFGCRAGDSIIRRIEW